jgi:hypothetical protein
MNLWRGQRSGWQPGTIKNSPTLWVLKPERKIEYMTVNEFVERVVGLRQWMLRISLVISCYLVYKMITPESIFGWFFVPVAGILICYFLEGIMKKLEFEF